MEDIRTNIAERITELRRAAGMTQSELAQHLSYSDKAVSKWERGESLPDIAVLVEIAELFGVSLDYLIKGERSQRSIASGKSQYNRKIILALSIALVWLVALVAFIVLSIVMPRVDSAWLAFLFAVPTSSLVWLVFNTAWFDPRKNYVIISLLMWSALACAHLLLLCLGPNLWQLYLLGVPGQAIIVMWSYLKSRSE